MDRIDIAMLYVMSLLPKTFRGEYFRALKKIHPRMRDISLEKKDFILLERQAEFGRLSEGILHDLMNPLTSISLHLERLKSNKEDIDFTKDSIDKIVDISKKMNQFIGSVKSVMINNDENDRVYRCDIRDAINTTIDIYNHKIKSANVKVIVKCNRKIYLNIHPVRLNQLLMNLISNSIDSFNTKDEDKPRSRKIVNTIRILVENNRDSENIYIKISDNGKGMDDIQKKDAFIKQFTGKLEGSGIGLLTIKDIVENDLRGKISLDSIQNFGTRILIDIPYKQKIN